MKRFDAMKNSKQSIIHKTNERINEQKPNKQKANMFYYISLAVLTCIVGIGLFSMIQKDSEPIEQSSTPINENLIEISAVADGTLIVGKDELIFQVDEHTLKTNSTLNEFLKTNSKIIIDEPYRKEIEEAYGRKVKVNAHIPSTFILKNLIIEEEQTYRAEQVDIVYHGGKQDHTLFTLNFNEAAEIVLDERLLQTYEAFKQKYDREQLRGLEPVDVFYLFEYAVEQGDWETYYELIMPDEPYYKPEKEAYIAELQSSEDSDFSHPFYGKEVYVDVFRLEGETKANIITEDEQVFFGLTQTKDGIWFVNFLPMQ